MESSMGNAHFCCAKNGCLNFKKCESISDCVFNLIIHEDENRILFYNFPEKRIFKIQKGKGIVELDFRDAIREIDIIPSRNASWKRCQILQLAKDLGFFGIN